MAHHWIDFAFRFKEIKTDQKWEDQGGDAHPKPPQKWVSTDGNDFGDWYRLKGGHGSTIPSASAKPESAISLVWCRLSQSYWVIDHDCTRKIRQGERANAGGEDWHEWKRLYFNKSPDELWRIHWRGDTWTYRSSCPPDFDEFLPVHFFEPGQGHEGECHLFGDITLILGLLAMCLSDFEQIPDRIVDHFGDNYPKFQQFDDRLRQGADRGRSPPRGLVMQTGIIKGSDVTSEDLDDLSNGVHGPIVSSHKPTDEQTLQWRLVVTR